MIYNLMFDENNQTAVKRYSDLVYIMNKLGFQTCSVSTRNNKENDPAHSSNTSAFKLSSQPFVPKSTSSDNSVRSPLVDLQALPQPFQDSSSSQPSWNVNSEPNFDFLKPSLRVFSQDQIHF